MRDPDLIEEIEHLEEIEHRLLAALRKRNARIQELEKALDERSRLAVTLLNRTERLEAKVREQEGIIAKLKRSVEASLKTIGEISEK